MSIRIFQEQDAEEILNIKKRCLIEINSKFYPHDIIAFMMKDCTSENIKYKAEKTKFIVYEDNGKIIGTAYLELENGYIGGLFINPDYHRKGIGKALMLYLENSVCENGIKKVIVQTAINTIDFYLKIGYKKGRKYSNPFYGITYQMKKKIK